MERSIYKYLLDWKLSKGRKVLLVRGARQVGKTYVIRQLGQTFDSYVEVNFERDSQVSKIFDSDFDVRRIKRELSAFYGKGIESGKTLLFLDEIQACKRAIQSLRYFYEEMPDLHVVATGSLLEFAIEDLPSWGVGRIRSLFMYPMSFDEFLHAGGYGDLVEIKRQSNAKNPLNTALHKRLTEQLKVFMTIGGMPEVVRTFLNDQSDLSSVQGVVNDITLSYTDDFAKYRKRTSVELLVAVINSAIDQSGGKFNFSRVSRDTHYKIKEAFQLLVKAGLIHQVFHTSGNGIPMGSEVNRALFKCLILDPGIWQRRINLKLKNFIGVTDVDFLNKGALAEVFAGLELVKYADPYYPGQMYYWHREKRGATAEVDYLIDYRNQVCPIEVKSGRQGKMQSLFRFMDEKESTRGIRISLEKFAAYNSIEVVPLYSISNLF